MINIKIQGGDLGAAFNRGAGVLGKLSEKITQSATKTLLRNARVYITETKAIDTGFLRGPGMRDTRMGLNKRKLENTAPYAIYIHEGTGRMRKRPFFDESIRRSKREISSLIKDVLNITLLSITR